jgi:predicted nucleic acid-binding protein
VLSSKSIHNLPNEKIKKRLVSILLLRSLKLEHRETLLKALDLYGVYKLDFEDCLSLAYMVRQRLAEIYSYDHDFDRVGNVERVEPKG